MQRSSHDFYLISITTSYYIWFLVSNLFLFHFLIPIFPSSACWPYAAVPLRTPFGSSWGPTCYAYGLQWFCRRPRTGDWGPEVSWNTSNWGIFQLLFWLPMRYTIQGRGKLWKIAEIGKVPFFPLLNNFCKPTEFRRHFLTFPSDEVPCTSWIWKQECLFPVILLHTRVPKKASNFLWGVTAKLHQASFRNKLYM